MFQIVGPPLNQWDTGRQVMLTDSNATHVHFANQGDSKAVIIEVTEGIAKIPDYLLQTGKMLLAYAVLDGVTIEIKSFSVRKRERPENYVYEDDRRNYIYELITNAENAVVEANQAATAANTASASANLSATRANQSADSAALAAKNANDAADKANHAAKSLMVVGAAKGDIIHLDDAIDQFLVGLRIFGKTTQDGVPTPEAPVDMVSVGGVGSLGISIAGKNLFGGDALADRLVKIGNATKDTTEGTVEFAGNIVSKKMLYSGFKKNTVYTIILRGWNDFGDGSNLWINYTDGSNAYLTFPASKTLSTIVYKTAANKTVKMISGIEYAGHTYLYYNQCGVFEGDINTGDFEAYVGQSINVDTPNGLPGLPVTSGGNYTDANGQQWICDDINFETGLYTQRIRKITSQQLATAGSLGAHDNGVPFLSVWSKGIANKIAPMSTRYEGWISSTQSGRCYCTTDGLVVNDARFTDLSTARSIMSSEDSVFLCPLATPIETPLSEAELAAYASLHTYRNSTTVSNDAGAYMELEYVLDAKKYIDSITAASPARLDNITLPASAWAGSDSLYSQVVTIAGITPYSKVDLLPSVEQLAIFHNKDVAFVTENEDGVVTVFAIGDKPQLDYTMQVSITEVTV